ncbi:hypothetical protein KY290_037073 [Solanum tuberosum]|uniref:Uncharacterized protein n=1 Tax=Solanum tuberosum TaxID=4113 RepID=A0ABQ7TVY3_SOLTU|nr:hypothetical protein KY290_037073 [Solanum tuberosum]
MTATSKSSCLLPRGLDRRIRCGAKSTLIELSEFSLASLEWSSTIKRKEDALIRERKDRNPALTRLPFVSYFRSGVAALLPILVLDFQLHSSEEEDSKSPPVVILLGLGVESLSSV